MGDPPPSTICCCIATPLCTHPKGEPMIPKPRMMIGIAGEAEQAAHRYGWDRAPLLGVVLAAPTGLMTGPFPIQPFEIADDGDVLFALQTVADAVEQVPEDKLVLDFDYMSSTFAGLWYMTELWWAPNDTVVPVGLGIADTPDAKEARLMLFIDCGGRLYTAYRVRGEAATVGEGMLAEGGQADIATIVDSLRRMMLSLGRLLPPSAFDLPAVAKVRADA